MGRNHLNKDTMSLMSQLIKQANKAQCLLIDVLKNLEENQLLAERDRCRCRDYYDSDCSDNELVLRRKIYAVERGRRRDRSHSRGRSRGHSRGRSHGRSRSRSYTNTQRKQLEMAVSVK